MRPRLLKGSPYRLKTLRGQLQALRDGARDLMVYLDRARWVSGLDTLTRDLSALKPVFTELTRLVGEWRQKLGGPLPASCSLQLNSPTALAALPALLAVDLRSLLAVRGSKEAAEAIAEILAETVVLLRQALHRAGSPLPPEETISKRAAAKEALSAAHR